MGYIKAYIHSNNLKMLNDKMKHANAN